MDADANVISVALTKRDLAALKAIFSTLIDNHFILKKAIDRIETDGADDAYVSQSFSTGCFRG
jgi:hypothetical protein